MKQILFIYRRMFLSKKFIYFYRKDLLMGLAAFLATIIIGDVYFVFNSNCLAAEKTGSHLVTEENIVLPNYNQGLDCLNRGEYDKAVEFFKTALKNNENNLDCHYRLANIYRLVQGDLEKSKYHFDEYMAILTSLNESGQLEEQDVDNQADESFVESKKLFEESAVLAGSNNISEAKIKLEQAVKLTPDDPVILYNLAVMNP